MAALVPLCVVDEIEALQAIYGELSVQLHGEPGGDSRPTKLELDLRPEEDGSLVAATLLIALSARHPLEAPVVEMYRSKGMDDSNIESIMKVAQAAIVKHGDLGIGCLAQLAMAASAEVQRLAAGTSECCICLDPCSASEAVSAPCGDVFHEGCLKEWADVKKGERTAAADAASAPIANQILASEREVSEAKLREQEAAEEVKNQEFKVQESEVWCAKMQRRAQRAMGEDDDEDDGSDEEGSEGSSEQEEDDGEDDDGRDGRHAKIKFNNSHWGAGSKKNHKPSTTLNRRRPKKYLNAVKDIIEDRKEEAKAEMREKASAELSDLEAANLDLRDAKALLDKLKADLTKAQMRTAELQASLLALRQKLADTRDAIIMVPIPCPVCTNPLDPDGVMPLMEKKKTCLEEEADADEAFKIDGEMRLRRAQAAAGKIDIRLEMAPGGAQRGAGDTAASAEAKDAKQVLGIYVRDAEPSDGLPDGRPTYTGAKGAKLQYVEKEDGWFITLGRLRKASLTDDAKTPDYASQGGFCPAMWRVATAEGWRSIPTLRAVCVNAHKAAAEKQREARHKEAAAMEVQCQKAEIITPAKPAKVVGLSDDVVETLSLLRQTGVDEEDGEIMELVSELLESLEGDANAQDEVMNLLSELMVRSSKKKHSKAKKTSKATAT